MSIDDYGCFAVSSTRSIRWVWEPNGWTKAREREFVVKRRKEKKNNNVVGILIGTVDECRISCSFVVYLSYWQIFTVVCICWESSTDDSVNVLLPMHCNNVCTHFVGSLVGCVCWKQVQCRLKNLRQLPFAKSHIFFISCDSHDFESHIFNSINNRFLG